MQTLDIAYVTEDSAHDAIVQIINEEAFGPGRFTRAAERVREEGPHDRALSFVASENNAIVASVRMTPIFAGALKGHLLGPLAVRPSHKNRGIGRALVGIAVSRALDRGSEGVVLVGDPPYYQPLGFSPVPFGALDFPGPVDPARVLVAGCPASLIGRAKGRVSWRAG